MIASITRGNSFKPILIYHQKKINQGRGEVIFRNTISDSPRELNREFTFTKELNKRIKKNYSYHISLSLPPDESMDNNQFTSLAQDYLNMMGFKDVPFVIYMHTDTPKDHIHILTTTIDRQGNWIDYRDDHYRSQQISRMLEKKYNLKQTNYSKSQTKKLSEINHSKYSLQNALNKADLNDFQSIIPPHINEKISSKKPITNNALRDLFFKSKNGGIFLELKEFLIKRGLVSRLKKDVLLDQLRYVKSISSNYYQFQKLALQNNIYMRELVKPSGKMLVFGIKHLGIYLKENQLPSGLKYLQLSQIGQSKSTEHSRNSQIKYLKQQITRNLKYSTSIEHLIQKLLKANITASLATNKSGPYGITFHSNNIKNTMTFKGSEIHRSFSLKNILKKIEETKMSLSLNSVTDTKNFEKSQHQKLTKLIRENKELGKVAKVYNNLVTNLKNIVGFSPERINELQQDPKNLTKSPPLKPSKKNDLDMSMT